MHETQKFDAIHGYTVKQAVCFDNDRGFALAHNPKAVQPWVSWRFTDENGVRDYYWGRYCGDKPSALQTHESRIGEYRQDFPSLTEKYNYLAAAEMGEEQNYNMIDGVPNNTAAPSILDQLRQYQSKPSEPLIERTERPDRTGR